MLRFFSPTHLAGFLLTFLALAACGANGGSLETESPATSSAKAGLSVHSIASTSLKRNYVLYVPRSAEDGPLPVVISFHGGGGSAEKMSAYAEWAKLAEEEGFIVVYPNGTYGKRANGGTWNTGTPWVQGSAEKRGINDLAFFDAMLADIKEKTRVDESRIFVTGMSKGGMMAYHIACNRADVIRGAAPVAATMTTAECNPSKPVNIFHIHGDNDENVPFAGGRGKNTLAKGANYRSVPEVLGFWVTKARCSEGRQDTDKGDTFACYEYCAQVSLCVVEGGHAWPGSETKGWHKRLNITVNQEFQATREIWEHFESL